MTRKNVLLFIFDKCNHHNERFGVGILKTGTFSSFHICESIACGVNIIC
jgi:hypothetical protein